MRALVYTDLQATDGHERMFTDTTKSLQLWRVNRLFEDLKRIYQQEGCDALWDLGDTTDDRTAVPVPAIDLLCQHLSHFAEGAWNIKLIGNHEQYLRNTQVNVAKLFAPYFTVVEQPATFEVEGFNVVCAPYPDTEESLAKFLRGLNRAKPTILLGHFQIVGCFGHSGQLMSGTPLALIDWVKLGLLGHIHKPQSFGNVHYVGSPFQQNWGEAGEEKRVGIVDISGTSVSVKWVPLEGYPQYLDVTLEEYEQWVSENSEDRYRIRLKSATEASRFYTHPLAHRFEPEYCFDVSASETKTDVELEGDTWEPTNVLRRYAERNKPADKNIALPFEEMIEIGKQLLSP